MLSKSSVLLIIAALVVPTATEAKPVEQELVIPLSPTESLVLQGSPSLHKRKVSSVTFRYLGDQPFQLVSFNAEMPQHNHGMIVQPSQPKKLNGSQIQYRIDGIKLHMPGEWLLTIKWRSGENLRQTQYSMTLKP